MPDNPAPSLDALVQSLPKERRVVEVGWSFYEPSTTWLRAFYDWNVAREREEEAQRLADQEAAALQNDEEN